MSEPTLTPNPKGLIALEVVGYELEIRPVDGVWSKFEGRVVKLVQRSGAPEPYRFPWLPARNLREDGVVMVSSHVYWMRSRSREKLETKLKQRLNEHLERVRRSTPESVPLEQTMAGWQ
jgi:hypothetical protein